MLTLVLSSWVGSANSILADLMSVPVWLVSAMVFASPAFRLQVAFDSSFVSSSASVSENSTPATSRLAFSTART